MEITSELILRFFRNQCTAAEATAVADYLALHPQLQEEFLSEQSWNEITAEDSVMADHQQTVLLEKIRLRSGISKPQRKSIWWMSAAASILIIAGLALWQHRKPAAVDQPVQEVVHNLVQMNYGKEDMVLEIIDGSTIVLKPGSEIRYAEYFTGSERNFYLKGMARFKVAKDPSRPFKVYTGETVTTALGTEFSITNREGDHHVLIALHEGRVVVGPENKNDLRNMKAVYLKPGQQLAVNKAHLTTKLSDTQQNKRNAEKAAGITEISATTISFKNQGLAQIFGTLEKEFAIKTHFKAKDVTNLYFTGTFDRDSLSAAEVIKEIALLNHFKIDKQGNAYYLSKP